MPNWMSDDDMKLESGEYRQCEHCGEIYSIDEHHLCNEKLAHLQADAAREKAEYDALLKRGLRAVKITIEIVCLDSDSAQQDAISDATTYKGVGSDDILMHKWRYTEQRLK